MTSSQFPGALDVISPVNTRETPSLADVLNKLQQTIGTTAAPQLQRNRSVFSVRDQAGSDAVALGRANELAHAAGGTVWFEPGFYAPAGATFGVTQPNVNWLGHNSNSVVLQPVVTGDFIRWQMNPFSMPLSGPTSGPWQGNGGAVSCGKIGGLTIDGINSPGANACGLHYGDACNGAFDDLIIARFHGASAVGLWMDNVEAYTEGTVWDRVKLFDNTTDLQFTVNGGTNSFGYQRIKDLRLAVNPGQVGIAVEPGALVYNGEFGISANLAPAASGPQAIFCTVTGITNVGATALSGDWSLMLEQTGGTPGQSTGFVLTQFGALVGSGHIDLTSNAPVSFASGPHPGSVNVSGWAKLPGLGVATAGTSLDGNGLNLEGSSAPGATGLYTFDALQIVVQGGPTTGTVLLKPRQDSALGEATLLATGELALTGPTATSATAGAATALPATPLGYLEMEVGGTQVKVPYYAT